MYINTSTVDPWLQLIVEPTHPTSIDYVKFNGAFAKVPGRVDASEVDPLKDTSSVNCFSARIYRNDTHAHTQQKRRVQACSTPQLENGGPAGYPERPDYSGQQKLSFSGWVIDPASATIKTLVVFVDALRYHVMLIGYAHWAGPLGNLIMTRPARSRVRILARFPIRCATIA